MEKGQRFIYVKEFDGEPKLENFRLEEYELPELKENEILCLAEYLSVDPYMRVFKFEINNVMAGGQIAKIIKSKHSKYPENNYIFGMFGWQTHTIVDPDIVPTHPGYTAPYILPDFGKLPRSLGLGSLGMPGCSAYFGFLEICQPKAGETVVVSTAAGAVGNLVGQIAKIKGCHVIGLTGTDEKCNWIKNELGFDHAINYKTTANLTESLKNAAPDGVDCYFDNVGGDISSVIINQMNQYGRISVCGSISAYNCNKNSMPKSTILQPDFVFKQLKMEGFIVYRWTERYMDATKEILNWINDGKIQYKETITNNFDKMPEAFMKMLNGENIGKAIVKV